MPPPCTPRPIRSSRRSPTATKRPAEVDHRRQGVPQVAQAGRSSPTPTFGIPTVTDILAELEKPGRDPRPEFKTATFQEGVEKIADLKPGMQLEGVVTNVTAFGAFVDVGVHQDGLVHISELSDRFVKDPREVVKAGDVVKVRVKEVDVARKRIALTMKSGAIDRVARGARDRRARLRRARRRSAPAPGTRAAGRERARRRPAPRPGAQVASSRAGAAPAARRRNDDANCERVPLPHLFLRLVDFDDAAVDVGADDVHQVLDLVLEEVVGVGHDGVLDLDALLHLGLGRQLGDRGATARRGPCRR